jgi:4-alpha-glucanotransferase
MDDIPIYVAHDSADVWAHPDLYYLDDQGRPTVVSGVRRAVGFYGCHFI